MNYPTCYDSSQTKSIFSKFNHTDYSHAYCKQCGISFDSNISEVLSSYTDLDASRIEILGEKEHRKYFIETSDITDGSDDIYTSFNWDSQDELKAGAWIQFSCVKK